MLQLSFLLVHTLHSHVLRALFPVELALSAFAVCLLSLGAIVLVKEGLLVRLAQ